MSEITENAVRRRLLRSISALGVLVWSKPSVQAVILPAHAMTTQTEHQGRWDLYEEDIDDADEIERLTLQVAADGRVYWVGDDCENPENDMRCWWHGHSIDDDGNANAQNWITIRGNKIEWDNENEALSIGATCIRRQQITMTFNGNRATGEYIDEYANCMLNGARHMNAESKTTYSLRAFKQLP